MNYTLGSLTIIHTVESDVLCISHLKKLVTLRTCTHARTYGLTWSLLELLTQLNISFTIPSNDNLLSDPPLTVDELPARCNTAPDDCAETVVLQSHQATGL